MSAAAIVAAGVAVLVALIGATSLWLSDRRKKKEESRKLAITAYGKVRTAWDQAQIEDVTLAVRREKLQEMRRGLVEIELLMGRAIRTREIDVLLGVLDSDPLGSHDRTLIALAKVTWPTVDSQIQQILRAR